MHMRLFLIAILLAGCTASVNPSSIGSGMELRPYDGNEEAVSMGSGSTYIGKISTVGAVNSRRSFIADYHGEVGITIYDNRQIECRFWAEGRITDSTVFDGPNGFIESFSTLCAGRLQRDGTFEFQGAYLFDGPSSGASGELMDSKDEQEQTFTMRGEVQNDEIIGDLIIGGLFRNAVVIADPSMAIDTGEGVRFTAALRP